MGAPYLGLQYVASSLLSRGHDVRCLDLAAVRSVTTDEDAIALVDAYCPDVVGMTLFTYNALAAYELGARLADKNIALVAGGPHVTVRPLEALDRGFDAAVVGEGELAMAAIADAIDRGAAPATWHQIPGVSTHAGRSGGGFLDDLDGLPFPHRSLGVFDVDAYGGSSWLTPGGTVTSRGCPARCTFCANYVTGRTFRYRSAANVVAELIELKDRHGLRHFAFWDDAFTANRPRLAELCDALVAEPRLDGMTWTCITPANMARGPTLERMAAAGCVAVNFGIESGDPSVLKGIRKGQRPQTVIDAVRTARGLGMKTVVNFMFGFPGEGLDELDATAAVMREIAEAADFFNNRGVLVPFPGTPVYEAHHQTYGFTNWWLNERYVAAEPDLFALDPHAAQRYLELDPALELDFFGYAPDVRERIAELVRFKARHNQATLARMTAAATAAYAKPDLAGESMVDEAGALAVVTSADRVSEPGCA